MAQRRFKHVRNPVTAHERVKEAKKYGRHTCLICIELTDRLVIVPGDYGWQLHFLRSFGLARDEARVILGIGPEQIGGGAYYVCESCWSIDKPNPYAQPQPHDQPCPDPEKVKMARQQLQEAREERKRLRAQRRAAEAAASTEIVPIVHSKRSKHDPTPRCVKCKKRPAIAHETLCTKCKAWASH